MGGAIAAHAGAAASAADEAGAAAAEADAAGAPSSGLSRASREPPATPVGVRRQAHADAEAKTTMAARAKTRGIARV
jgi:hypothetical protein